MQGDYAYVAAEDAGLRVVDISSPRYVQEIGQYNTPGTSSGIVVSSTLAYVADGWSGLRIISVNDLTAPTEIGSLSIPGYANQVEVVGDYAYVASWTGGIRVISISDPTNPVEVGYYITPGDAYDLQIIGSYAYVADYAGGGLRILDISNPANITEIGFYDTPGWAEHVFVLGQTAYVSDWASLRIISVADPANPVELGYYYAPSFIHETYVTGTQAYLATDVAGLQIISVADSSWPTLTSHYDTPGLILHLDPADQYIAAADGHAGIQMIDTSTPDKPAGYGFSVAGYNVEYREAPSGSWLPWLTNSLTTTTRFTGQDNQQYCFRSQGIDWVNNVEFAQFDYGVDGHGADTCTTIHAPVIDFDHFTVDDDQSDESFGNGDGQVNPGESVELHLWLNNIGSGDASGLYIQPVTSDSCVDGSGVYFFDGYVYFGDLSSGQAGESLDDFDFTVNSNCSPGHTISFDLTISDQTGNTWYRTLHVPVSGTDDTPPTFWYEQASPKYALANESTTLSAFVIEQSDVSWVRADISSTDGTFTTTLTLYDDGAHNDGAAGDMFFANEWTPSVEADFEAVITASDIYGNIGSGATVHFTSERFVSRSDILLVYDDWDSHWTSDVITYYTEALEANGLPYDVWDGIYRGAIFTDTLTAYRDGLVIWAVPQYGNIYYKPEVQEAIQDYLDSGGNLFISGQDIGYYLTWNGTITNTFYQDYLHAQFVNDDVNLYALDGYINDPLFTDSHLSISGSSGANNQWWPSEIAPIEPALPIYIYNASATAPASAMLSSLSSDSGIVTKPSPEQNQAPDGPSQKTQIPDTLLSASPLAVTVDQVGAIKVNTGIYRVIYFAFGFEAINGQNGDTRADVLDKVVSWLLPNRPPRMPDYPYPRPDSRVLPPSMSTEVQTASIINEVVQDPGVELWWSANDPDPGDNVRFDVYLGTAPIFTEADKVVTMGTDMFYIPPLLELGNIYYWQVIAWDEDGAQSVGPVWSFEFGVSERKVYLPIIITP